MKIYCANTGMSIELDEDQTNQMMFTEVYTDVQQVIARVISASMHQIIVPSCYGKDREE